MAYKTILAHWSGDGTEEALFDFAGAVAARFDAHLTGLVFGIEPNIAAYSYGAPGAGVIAAQTEQAEAEAIALKRAAEAWIERSGRPGDVRAVLASLDGLAHATARHARYADLVVMQEPYATERDDICVRVLEGALFEGAAPVLICPRTPPASVGTNVMIAWDRSVEALHAIRAALPFLVTARRVELTLIDPQPSESGQDDPGADMALVLSRHGVPIEVAQVPSAGLSVPEALRKRVMHLGADLLVMGGYSHSRFREALIGGATRDMLEIAPAPILMAH